MKKFLIAVFGSSIIFTQLFAQTKDTRTLFTIAGEPVSVEDFTNVYGKNNINNQADYSEKSLREYLDLYTKFKLKVKQAEDLKLDTIESLKAELGTYRKQLAKSYLNDKEIYNNLEIEAYDRMQTEINVSHILIRVANDASPADTLAAYNKLNGIRKSILKGESFESAAAKYSEDPSAKSNNGRLGYLTVFQTVYPFENQMYNTAPGQVSGIFRTKFGYHILKVNDKRPARGSVNIAHIVITVPDKFVGNGDSVTQFKINKIYNDIKSGAISFEDAVTQYSEDRKSKMNKGEIGFFSTGKMTESFENAAFALKNIGDISAPVKTSYGYHILKLIDKKPVPPMMDIKSELKQKIERDSRSDLSRTALMQKIKSKYGFTENTLAKNEILKMIDSTILDGRWRPLDISGYTKMLFKVGSEETTQDQFLNFILKNQKNKRVSNSISFVYENLYEDYVEQRCMDFEEKQLDAEYPDFKSLMKEYRDGILLFDLTDKMVWTKATKDTAGLKAFYETDKDKYKWGNRVEVDIYNCSDSALAKMTRKLLLKGKTPDEITKQVNIPNAKSKVSIIHGKYEKGQYELIDNTDRKVGLKENIYNKDGSVTIINILREVGPEPKLLNEAKGYIVSDYQEYLEKQWISDLRAKYAVVVNDAVFRSLIKK
ncbi:MAG: peptidylprolyl isomerase [Bacteroidota bacterium]